MDIPRQLETGETCKSLLFLPAGLGGVEGRSFLWLGKNNPNMECRSWIVTHILGFKYCEYHDPRLKSELLLENTPGRGVEEWDSPESAAKTTGSYPTQQPPTTTYAPAITTTTPGTYIFDDGDGLGAAYLIRKHGIGNCGATVPRQPQNPVRHSPTRTLRV
ncbi:hypothetical protein P167DRAFT_550377 [Morchella conica CCBAS932]|uniref:Uncharacterized protein n=1 Tax=Morchella conica CCBAS932 TaxID=1392247 RepID=A0A3N4KLI5_9PEZI|nr:hypothetical protein P167DRAFT_550377 [Morchella conica CCBAS932]